MSRETITRLIAGFGVLVTLSSCANKEEWKVRAFNDTGFSALMPAEPVVKNKVDDYEHYTSKLTKYLTLFGDADSKREYDIYYINTVIPDSNRQRFTEIVDSSKFSKIVFDAQRQAFEEENYQLVGWKDVFCGKYPGREMDMIAGDKTHLAFLRAFQKGYNVYMILARVPIDDTAEAFKFMESLHID